VFTNILIHVIILAEDIIRTACRKLKEHRFKKELKAYEERKKMTLKIPAKYLIPSVYKHGVVVKPKGWRMEDLYPDSDSSSEERQTRPKKKKSKFGRLNKKKKNTKKTPTKNTRLDIIKEDSESDFSLSVQSPVNYKGKSNKNPNKSKAKAKSKSKVKSKVNAPKVLKNDWLDNR